MMYIIEIRYEKKSPIINKLFICYTTNSLLSPAQYQLRKDKNMILKFENCYVKLEANART